MQYSFTFDARDGWLHVRVHGDNTAAVVRRYIREMIRACQTEGCPNVLIEEILEGPRLSVGDVFAIVSEESEGARGIVRHIAYVDVNSSSPANMKFAETVASNRGVSIGMFTSVPDAEKWLRKKLAPPKKPTPRNR